MSPLFCAQSSQRKSFPHVQFDYNLLLFTPFLTVYIDSRPRVNARLVLTKVIYFCDIVFMIRITKRNVTVVGDEVNWVQCDTCEQWFHLLCVGLAEDEVAGNEDYMCFICKNDGGTGNPCSLSVPLPVDAPLSGDSDVGEMEEEGIYLDEMGENAVVDEGEGPVGEEGVILMEEDQMVSSVVVHNEGVQDSIVLSSPITSDAN